MSILFIYTVKIVNEFLYTLEDLITCENGKLNDKNNKL